ncbi:hypothetical protein JOD54_001449 [Actinokineospora baliensis]|nr:hypothetical protein [Actinokineospora baliensis]
MTSFVKQPTPAEIATSQNATSTVMLSFIRVIKPDCLGQPQPDQ